MADYLVLEEDGTSHILTETGDSLLLEESSPQLRSVSFTANPEINVSSSVVPAAGQATWRVGTITVPSSTGSTAVTGLGGTPKAVFFYGTNWLTEDAAQTGDGLGMFRGMAAPKWDAPGTMLQNAACVVSTPAGNAHVIDNWAILQSDTSGVFSNYRYVANVTSFDVDGFTVNWSTVTAGGYKVVYVALMDVAEVGARVGLFDGTTIDLGFKAGSSLLHGAWFGPATGLSIQTQEFYGGAAYPGGTDYDWEACGNTLGCFPASYSAQFVNELSLAEPHIRVATGMRFTGPFLVPSNITAYPTGSPAAGNNFYFGGETQDGGMVVVWDDEDSRCFAQYPAQANAATSTKTGLPFEPGLLLGYNIAGEPGQQGGGGQGAIGFSVVTPDFQWCATINGTPGNQGAYQSFQRGFCDAVNVTDIHTGTVELTADGFVMTTEEDDLTLGEVVWHAFGHPDRVTAWLPHIYRRILG